MNDTVELTRPEVRALNHLCKEITERRMRVHNPHVITLALKQVFPDLWCEHGDELFGIEVTCGVATWKTVRRPLDRNQSYHDVIWLIRYLRKRFT